MLSGRRQQWGSEVFDEVAPSPWPDELAAVGLRYTGRQTARVDIGAAGEQWTSCYRHHLHVDNKRGLDDNRHPAGPSHELWCYCHRYGRLQHTHRDARRHTDGNGLGDHYFRRLASG